MATEQIKSWYYDERGVLVINAAASESNSDWIRAARLKRKADQGDKKAKEELERMDNTPMMQEVDVEE